MPKKTIPNHVVLREAEDVISFFTHSKKNHFDSEAKIFDDLGSVINGINPNYLVHLSSYPYIAVHVSFGLVGGLAKDKSRIEAAIQQVLERHLRQN